MKKISLSQKLALFAFITGVCFSLFSNAHAEYSYAKELEASPVYDNTKYFKLDASIPETPIGIGAGGGTGGGFVGTMKNCEWAIARCDQDQVGFYPA